MTIPPTDVARATLMRIADRGLSPTPENYAQVYREMDAALNPGHELPPVEHALTPEQMKLLDAVRTMIVEATDKAAGHAATLAEQNKEIRRTVDDLAMAQERKAVLALVGTLVTTANGIHETVNATHDDLLVTRNTLEEIRAGLQENRAAMQEDYLTGAQNRRGMDQALNREVARARRSSSKFSVAMLDVDHFKAVNDTYGHHVGDQFLVHLAEIIRSVLRESDVLVRYGGEEFMLILPDTDVRGAQFVVDRLRHLVHRTPMNHEGHKIAVTLSAGVAQFRNEENGHNLVIRADTALLAAKDAGRNCIRLAED